MHFVALFAAAPELVGARARPPCHELKTPLIFMRSGVQNNICFPATCHLLEGLRLTTHHAEKQHGAFTKQPRSLGLQASPNLISIQATRARAHAPFGRAPTQGKRTYRFKQDFFGLQVCFIAVDVTFLH